MCAGYGLRNAREACGAEVAPDRQSRNLKQARVCAAPPVSIGCRPLGRSLGSGQSKLNKHKIGQDLRCNKIEARAAVRL